MATLINNWTKTALTTISDSYLFLVSLTSGETRPISWASLKALLATYFDSLYLKVTGVQTVEGTKTFTSPITGSITGNAGTVTNGIYKNGSVPFSAKQTFHDSGINIRDFMGALPTGSSDDMGISGDILYYGLDVYRKTSTYGWIKNGATF